MLARPAARSQERVSQPVVVARKEPSFSFHFAYSEEFRYRVVGVGTLSRRPPVSAPFSRAGSVAPWIAPGVFFFFLLLLRFLFCRLSLFTPGVLESVGGHDFCLGSVDASWGGAAVVVLLPYHERRLSCLYGSLGLARFGCRPRVS